jgi:hypothetical protein
VTGVVVWLEFVLAVVVVLGVLLAAAEAAGAAAAVDPESARAGTLAVGWEASGAVDAADGVVVGEVAAAAGTLAAVGGGVRRRG